METLKFNEMLVEHAEKKQVEPAELIISKGADGSIFLPQILAVFVASELNTKLRYEILDYYVLSRISKLRAVYDARIDVLKQEKINLASGIQSDRLA